MTERKMMYDAKSSISRSELEDWLKRERISWQDYALMLSLPTGQRLSVELSIRDNKFAIGIEVSRTSEAEWSIEYARRTIGS